MEEVEFFRGFVGPRLECPRSPTVAARGAERAPLPPRTCAALLDRPTEKSVGLTGLKAAVGGMFLSFERIEELRARIVFTPKLVFNKASFSNLRLPSSRFFSIWRSFAFFFIDASEEHQREHTRELSRLQSRVIPFFETMQTALASSTKSAAAAAGSRIRCPALAPKRQQQSRSVSVAALRDPVVIPSEFTKVRKA